MNIQEEQNKNIDRIIELLKKYNLKSETIKSFINQNINYIINDNNFIQRLYLIMNSKEIYAILYINKNNYYWSTLTNNCFTKFKGNNETDKNNHLYTDMIIEEMLHFTESNKIKELDSEIENKTIDEKVKTLKKIKLNKQGYHIE